MKKHKFSHTVVEHHADNTHTVHHIHEKHGHVHAAPVREGDVKGGAGDHDAMMDHIMDHTAPMNQGEADADAGQHGVPPAQAGPAGIPAPPAAAPAGA